MCNLLSIKIIMAQLKGKFRYVAFKDGESEML